jgi:hypothetical protein
MWPYYAPDDKRLCPIGGKHCYGANFDSYRQMLTHCRQKHPEKLPLRGNPAPELVVTDTHGKALSWEEMRQIVDHPLFWREPEEGSRSEEREEMSIIMFRSRGELLIS